jgi:AraC-like DNA-binding protein
MVDMLGESAGDLSSREAAGVADSLVDLLGAAIGSLGGAAMPLPRNIERYHRERIKDLIRLRLFDPDLTVEGGAAGVNLSLRYVHALFESEPTTLSAWIWHERLEAGRRALLADASDRRPVTDIALSVGFKDPAHFSRLFKATYGASPRDFRRSVASTDAS